MPPATSAAAFQQLQSATQNAQNPTQFLQQANQQYGVDQAQSTVTGLRSAINNTTNLLNNVAPSVQGRTANSLVTSAQADKQVANESAPIQSSLSTEGNQYNQANSDYADLEGKAQNEANAEIQGQNDQLSRLQNIYSDLYTSEQNTAQQQEAEREFNAQLAASNAASANQGFDVNPQAAAAPGLPQGMALKGANGGGGYDFSFGGNPVSAATFAQVNNQKIGDVLYTMAQSGDKTAAQAYQDILKNKGTITPALRSKYSSLFWGT